MHQPRKTQRKQTRNQKINDVYHKGIHTYGTATLPSSGVVLTLFPSPGPNTLDIDGEALKIFRWMESNFTGALYNRLRYLFLMSAEHAKT